MSNRELLERCQKQLQAIVDTINKEKVLQRQEFTYLGGDTIDLIDDLRAELSKPSPIPLLVRCKDIIEDLYGDKYLSDPSLIGVTGVIRDIDIELSNPSRSEDPRDSHGAALLMIADLNRKLAEAEKDAERYRFLRNNLSFAGLPFSASSKFDEDIDQAISNNTKGLG